MYHSLDNDDATGVGSTDPCGGIAGFGNVEICATILAGSGAGRSALSKKIHNIIIRIK